MRPMRCAALCLLLLAGLAPTCPAAAQTRYKLRCGNSVGDKCTIAIDEDLHCALIGSAKGQDSPEITVGQTGSRKFTQVIMATSAAGAATKLRRYHEKAEETLYVPTRGPVDRTTSFQGRTVVVGRQNGKVTVSSTPAGLAAAEKAEAASWLDQNATDLFPSADAAVGDEWDVTPRSMAGVLAGAKVVSAQVRAKFAEVTDWGGHSCARIEVTANIKGKLQGLNAVLSLKLSGNTYLALDLHRIVKTDISGPVTIEGTVVTHGMKVSVAGSGELTSKEETTWLQVDGKAVDEVK